MLPISSNLLSVQATKAEPAADRPSTLPATADTFVRATGSAVGYSLGAVSHGLVAAFNWLVPEDFAALPGSAARVDRGKKEA